VEWSNRGDRIVAERFLSISRFFLILVPISFPAPSPRPVAYRRCGAFFFLLAGKGTEIVPIPKGGKKDDERESEP
jgi:hypothetical protein